MKLDTDVKQWAMKAIEVEAQAIAELGTYIDDDFEKSVHHVFQCRGRVIATGIGKSAIIAEKIVATLNSTGTSSVFMHAADAIHGDLGIICPHDVVLCLSKSGNTPEIKVLIPLIRNMGNKIIAMVSSPHSYLGEHADYVLKAYVDAEACPNNLAPTTSTTAQLVLGDAFAICLLKLRGFSANDFARVHPGGSLGKKLYLRVSDIINKQTPTVAPDMDIRSVIIEISSNMLGATAVMNQNQEVIGIITDGDLRRMLEKNESFEKLSARNIMSPEPKTIDYDESAIIAFNIMEKFEISQLIVLKDGQYKGMVHVHDIMREGLV
ncbi:MAG: KpsF/GutQ family sugar-phosphate isomerase [Prevotellaceae bacterium]|jgi:arabinose-5-phosphate isomerase|nr:KpsF/GutQ family sugar-phosphate isomerase [Prevotellaceae bacterium]